MSHAKNMTALALAHRLAEHKDSTVCLSLEIGPRGHAPSIHFLGRDHLRAVLAEMSRLTRLAVSGETVHVHGEIDGVEVVVILERDDAHRLGLDGPGQPSGSAAEMDAVRARIRARAAAWTDAEYAALSGKVAKA